jgi:Ca-activated chloride channel homolog
MSWNAPNILLLLWLVPAIAVAMFVASISRRNTLARLGDPELIGRLMASRDRRKRFLKNTLILLSTAAAIVALAQPQTLSRKVNVAREGIDLVIVADVSLSMLAEDMDGSRIDSAKRELDRIVAAAPVDRIGLIAFSGGTQMLSPMTSDRNLIRKLVADLRPETVPVKGTMLGMAMQTGLSAFVEKQRKARIMLLITDGEDFNPFPIHLAQKAKNDGIRLVVVGVGTPEGKTIPLRDGSGSKALMMDSEGKLVYTSLNDGILMKVAEASGGSYTPAYGSPEPFGDIVLRELGDLQKAEAFQDVVVQHENRFQWPLLFAVIGLLLEVSLSERRRVVA